MRYFKKHIFKGYIKNGVLQFVTIQRYCINDINIVLILYKAINKNR